MPTLFLEPWEESFDFEPSFGSYWESIVALESVFFLTLVDFLDFPVGLSPLRLLRSVFIISVFSLMGDCYVCMVGGSLTAPLSIDDGN